MIELLIKPEWVKKAKRQAAELGVLKNSITNGEGNIAGYLGEIIVENFYTDYLPIRTNGDRDCDLILVNGTRIDVKTKRRTVPPKPHYFASVAAFNTQQKCDYYVFVSVLNDFSKAWICGWYPKNKFFQDARYYKEGDRDPTGNGWTFRADCYNMALKDLQEAPC